MEHLELDEIATTLNLTKGGKIHRRLILRLAYLLGLSLIFLGIVVYDIIRYHLGWGAAIGVASVSFLIGLFLFTRMFQPIEWSDKKETMKLGRVDAAGLILVAIYVAFRLLAKQYIDTHYKINTISVVTYSSIFGVLFGRFIGMLGRIHEVNTGRLKKALGK